MFSVRYLMRPRWTWNQCPEIRAWVQTRRCRTPDPREERKRGRATEWERSNSSGAIRGSGSRYPARVRAYWATSWPKVRRLEPCFDPAITSSPSTAETSRNAATTKSSNSSEVRPDFWSFRSRRVIARTLQVKTNFKSAGSLSGRLKPSFTIITIPQCNNNSNKTKTVLGGLHNYDQNIESF